MNIIEVSEFVKRQTPESRFSHFDGTWDELRDLVSAHSHDFDQGYREGVVLVNVPPDRFFSATVNIEEGLKSGAIKEIRTEFKARRDGEEKVLHVFAVGKKQAAKKVQIVLYHRDVLAEGKEVTTDADWEIICIIASPTDEVTPMDNITRARNVLVEVGGTDPCLEDKSKEELIDFITDTAHSSMFWARHITVLPE